MTSFPRVLGVSGSLRCGSVNSMFLDATALIAPGDTEFRIYHEMGSLPLLVSPEYAHGVTGVIKNALDWIVGSGELFGKLLAFPNLSARANLAHNQLAETR